MIYKLAFGDASGDGHREFVNTWASCPDKKCFINAKENIKKIYGKNFFDGFAHDYEDDHLSSDVWQALYDAKYPIERFFDTSDYNWKDQYPEVITLLDIQNTDIMVWIDQVVDMYYWLLNYHGACLTKIATPFESLSTDNVGYGCFD